MLRVKLRLWRLEHGRPADDCNILSIAGTDPTGGAGIQADLKTFAALGTYGMAAITAVVAQNTLGVRDFVTLDPLFVAAQIDSVFDDVRVDAVKIGMVATAAIAEAIADRLIYHNAINVALDPVMVAKCGDHLLKGDAVAAIRDRLEPLATIITPNLPEAAVLLGDEVDWSRGEMDHQAMKLQRLGARWVLLKGGHLEGTEESVDVLVGEGRYEDYAARRILTRNYHGTGCTSPLPSRHYFRRFPSKTVCGRRKPISAALLPWGAAWAFAPLSGALGTAPSVLSGHRDVIPLMRSNTGDARSAPRCGPARLFGAASLAMKSQT